MPAGPHVVPLSPSRSHDCWKGRQLFISRCTFCALLLVNRKHSYLAVCCRCCQLHADRGLGAEEARILVPDQLCKVAAGPGNNGSQHVCQGPGALLVSPTHPLNCVRAPLQDSQDPNPLIRALAVRTMGCIRVDKITEYLCDPLQRCLKDDDPYVRKTAAMCVAKLHDINTDLVEDRGFLDSLRVRLPTPPARVLPAISTGLVMLQDLIGDANPMVVANAVAALSEIQATSDRDVFSMDPASLSKLLRAVNECTEWGQVPPATLCWGLCCVQLRTCLLLQVFILDALARYSTPDPKEAHNIVDRVTPRLQHANSAVVLSAVKVILKHLEVGV